MNYGGIGRTTFRSDQNFIAAAICGGLALAVSTGRSGLDTHLRALAGIHGGGRGVEIRGGPLGGGHAGSQAQSRSGCEKKSNLHSE